jgi:hypothetical protein
MTSRLAASPSGCENAFHGFFLRVVLVDDGVLLRL